MGIYSILGLWDFGDTALFKAAVLPAVTLFSMKKTHNTKTSFHSIYKFFTQNDDFTSKAIKVDNPIEGIENEGLVQDSSGVVYFSNKGVLSNITPNAPWTLQNEETQKWLSAVKNNTFLTFKDIGKIRVGVKTTADNVFIHDNWEQETGCKPELLMPLITHNVAGQFKRTMDITKQILYPHFSEHGRRSVYDINQYPITQQYLFRHKKQLEGRKYIKDAGRQWYEIWVPQNPEFWAREKIVFRDISEHPEFWLEKDNSVVNGDCYWMVLDSETLPKDIIWLVLAIANSNFIERFYDCCFNNKLYSNKRRFISQYVEKFPIPDYNSIYSKEIIIESKNAYELGLSEQRKRHIDVLVNQAFGVS